MRWLLLLLLLVSWSNIYSQTDYAELEWVRKYFRHDSSANMAKVFAIDGYGNSYVTIVNCNCL
jgi:hypothetical protein